MPNNKCLLASFLLLLMLFALPALGQVTEDVLKIDTSLVTFSVIVSDTNDVYLPDLKKEEFQILEDGKPQDVAFFAAIREPFHVVLMIDTSGSTQEKLGQIRHAASAFVNQLQTADRVKLISFDDEVREWGGFTNNRKEVKDSIADLQPGKGTKLYDAVRLALNNLARIKGRKAIVLFTDGVDYHSFDAKYDDTIRLVEESGVIVYPLRYDTRLDTEAMIRDQQAQGGSVVLSDIIKTPPRGTTPTTLPGETRVPSTSSSGQGGVWDRIRTAPPIITGRRDDRYPDSRSPDPRYPDNRYPDPRYPDSRYPDSRYPDNRMPDSRYPDNRPRRGRDDGVGVMLDGLYRTADQYLNDLALKSGGKLHRADTLGDLPDAFGKIADELRTQYSLGYYPTNPSRAGKYRKLQVKVLRKGAVVRTRPGYREPRS